MELSFFIAKRLRSRKHGSFSAQISRIAVGSIALGLSVLILSVFIYQGFTKVIQEKLFSHVGHIRLTKFDLNNSLEESPVRADSEISERAPEIKGVKSIHAYAHKASLMKASTEVAGVLLKGIGAGFDTNRMKDYLIEGSFPDLSGKETSMQVVISKKLSQKLNVLVGDETILFFNQDPPRIRKLTVSGIYNTGIEEFDQAIIFGDLRVIQRLNGWGDSLVGGFEVFVKPFDQLISIEDEIYEVMDFDLTVQNVTETHSHYFDWFLMLRQNVNLTLFIILFIVAFNIAAVILIMIMERTRMIGSLKAFGATNWQIQKVFIYSGLRMTLWGLLIGNTLGVGISWLQKQFQFIALNPENYFMESVPVSYNWGAVAGLNVTIIVLIAGVLWLPSLFITKIEPVRAIKFN